MNLELLKNKTVLLLGKSRAFSADEFAAQMQYHKIEVLQGDALTQPPTLIIEGKMMSPYEQNRSDALYEANAALFCTIDALEKALAQAIDADTLVMSLKLSRDKERLRAFLKNGALEDGVFLRLLKLYDFQGEDFFENDANRDVSAALIERFYENIERNHNVQYATLGLMHLVAQTKSTLLLETLIALEPLKKAISSEEKSANLSILTAIATHPQASREILALFVKKGSSVLRQKVASRPECDEGLQRELYKTLQEDILEALSLNPLLGFELAKLMSQEKNYAKNIASHRVLNEEIFSYMVADYAPFLARNLSLDSTMQERLLETNDPEVLRGLAGNTALDLASVEKLLLCNDAALLQILYANCRVPPTKLYEALELPMQHVALASNQASSEEILTRLASSTSVEVLGALAKNPKTPVAILYQLRLDSRFERFVSENEAFGRHIQTENIGWLV